VVAYARAGQTLILTSTTYVGTTRELLVEPLAARGLAAGRDVHVAFAPERIDPGSVGHEQERTPRVVGGITRRCGLAAAAVLGDICSRVAIVSSAEAAEMTKLYENVFRAVNVALANELAGASGHYGLDAIEIIDAAATKPYGFMPFFPGAGVGGHCIPCDPHYLLAPLSEAGVELPLVEGAMAAIAARPREVAGRALQALHERGIEPRAARVLVVGVTYKPGVPDVRESPEVEILELLAERCSLVEYHDALVPTLDLSDGCGLLSVPAPDPASYDVVVLAIQQPDVDQAGIAKCDCLVDCTYRATGGSERVVI
jgi:UDP-N-acetyl-D-glucosamine dehydrogenase